MTKKEKIKQLISLVEVAIDKCDIVLETIIEVKMEIQLVIK